MEVLIIMIYQLSLLIIQEKVKVEVGNDIDGWFTQEWDRGNTISWQTKTLSVNKKASSIKNHTNER